MPALGSALAHFVALGHPVATHLQTSFGSMGGSGEGVYVDVLRGGIRWTPSWDILFPALRRKIAHAFCRDDGNRLQRRDLAQ